MTTKVKTVVNDILKPLKDDRLYRGLELNNGMKVLVVSDPKADKSSAALDVNIGYYFDMFTMFTLFIIYNFLFEYRVLYMLNG